MSTKYVWIITCNTCDEPVFEDRLWYELLAEAEAAEGEFYRDNGHVLCVNCEEESAPIDVTPVDEGDRPKSLEDLKANMTVVSFKDQAALREVFNDALAMNDLTDDEWGKRAGAGAPA